MGRLKFLRYVLPSQSAETFGRRLSEVNMNSSQFYQTTLVDLESNLSATLVIVPAGALVEPGILSDANSVCDRLDLTPRYISDSPSSLTYLLAAALTEDEAEQAVTTLFGPYSGSVRPTVGKSGARTFGFR